MKSFLLASNACGRTFLEVGQRLHKYLVANGLQPTQDAARADLLIVDTCGYCQAAEEESMGMVGYCLERRRPSAEVFVVGCLPGISPGRLRDAGAVNTLLPAELGKLDAVIDARIAFDDVPADAATGGAALPWDKGAAVKQAFHINTSTGCLHDCTFCAVKAVWGRLKSKPIHALVAELEAGLAMGHEVFYLAAQDLGAYGNDLGVSVVDLLAALFAVEGDFELILHDFNPQWLIKHRAELEPLLAQHAAKVAYLDIPLQSGSDRILKRMKRPYSAAHVRDALLSLKRAVPDLIVELDIMMGFPGETAEDFAHSMAFLREAVTLEGVSVWLSGYSDRPGTKASAMDDKVPADVIMERFLAMRRVVEQSSSRLGTGLAYLEGYRL